MNKMQIFFKKNSSTILSVVGSLGVIGTAILTAKATSKALEIIEESEKVESETLYTNCKQYEYVLKRELTLKTKIKITWKSYIPSFCMGVSTILCIFGSNYLNKKNQKALVSAYSVLYNTYLNYRNEVKTLYGNDVENTIYKKIIERHSDDIENDDNKELFFDCISMRYFRSTLDNVKKTEYLLNELLSTNEHVYLNDLYDLLNIDRVEYGYDLAWSIDSNDSLYSHDGVKIELELTEMDTGLECWIMNFSCQPNMNYLY